MAFRHLPAVAGGALDGLSIGDMCIQVGECWPEALLYYDPDKLRWMFGKIPERKARFSAILVHPYNAPVDCDRTQMNDELTFGVSIKDEDEASKEYASKLIAWWRGEVPQRKRITLL